MSIVGPMTTGSSLPIARISGVFAALLAVTSAFASERLIREATGLNFALDRQQDALYFDLYGALWTMPSRGGIATEVRQYGSGLDRPALSRDGRWLAVERCPGADCEVWLYDRQTGAGSQVMPGPWSTRMPAFSADSQTLAVASTRAGSFDVWALSLASDTARRISDGAGDELYPSFATHESAVIWAESAPGEYRLMRQRPGQTASVLYRSAEKIVAPSFRPDGSLVAFLEGVQAPLLRFVLGDGSGIAKTLAAAPPFETQAPIWLSRDRFLISAGGRPAVFDFATMRLAALGLQAFVSVAPQPPTKAYVPPPQPTANHGRYVLRVGKRYDSILGRLSGATDIVIADDRIESVGPPRVHADGVVVIDSPELTAVPGLVALRLSRTQPDRREWLRHGFTHLVCLDAGCATAGQRIVAVDPALPDDERLAQLTTARTAGFGVVSSRLYPDLAAGATAWLARRIPAETYADYKVLLRERQAAIVLPLDGIAALAVAADTARALTDQLLLATANEPRRFAGDLVRLAEADIVRDGDAGRLLRALTLDAALATGLGASAGQIAEGRIADLILVRGDPLTDPATLFHPAAIVTRGRYLTPAGLFASEYSD